MRNQALYGEPQNPITAARIAAWMVPAIMAMPLPTEAQARDSDASPRRTNQWIDTRDRSGNLIGRREIKPDGDAIIRDRSGNRIGYDQRTGSGVIHRGRNNERVGTSRYR